MGSQGPPQSVQGLLPDCRGGLQAILTVQGHQETHLNTTVSWDVCGSFSSRAINCSQAGLGTWVSSPFHHLQSL